MQPENATGGQERVQPKDVVPDRNGGTKTGFGTNVDTTPTTGQEPDSDDSEKAED